RSRSSSATPRGVPKTCRCSRRARSTLVQGEVAIESIGTLPILTAMYATAGMFVVRADSRYRTIDDLRGQPIAFGAGGSGLVILARYVLDGLGLDQQRD